MAKAWVWVRAAIGLLLGAGLGVVAGGAIVMVWCSAFLPHIEPGAAVGAVFRAAEVGAVIGGFAGLSIASRRRKPRPEPNEDDG